MTADRHRQTILALRSVAAQAEKLADDLQHGRLWEGDLARSLAEIRHALDDVRAMS